MENLNLKEIIEEKIKEFPILQYEWILPEELSFKEEVRQICERECPMYGKTWSCPPAVGTVEECRDRCMKYEGVFLFTTIAEVSDISNMEETLKTRGAHEAYTRNIGKAFIDAGAHIQMLSSESCAICEACSYCKGETCRYPQVMLPCIESYGILVTDIAENYGIDFYTSMTTVQWFGMIFYSKK